MWYNSLPSLLRRNAHQDIYWENYLMIMKKLALIVFAVALIFSSAIVSSHLPGDTAFSASAMQTTVARKRRPGIARRTYRGGRWVVRRTWDGTKWVYRRVWVATKWTGKKSWRTSPRSRAGQRRSFTKRSETLLSNHGVLRDAIFSALLTAPHFYSLI